MLIRTLTWPLTSYRQSLPGRRPWPLTPWQSLPGRRPWPLTPWQGLPGRRPWPLTPWQGLPGRRPWPLTRAIISSNRNPTGAVYSNRSNLDLPNDPRDLHMTDTLNSKKNRYANLLSLMACEMHTLLDVAVPTFAFHAYSNSRKVRQ